MSCARDITALKAKLVLKEAQLLAFNTAYTDSITNIEIKKYTFDSGIGRQTVERRSPKEIADAIYTLEREIESIRAELCGFGLVQLNYRSV